MRQETKRRDNKHKRYNITRKQAIDKRQRGPYLGEEVREASMSEGGEEGEDWRQVLGRRKDDDCSGMYY